MLGGSNDDRHEKESSNYGVPYRSTPNMVPRTQPERALTGWMVIEE